MEVPIGGRPDGLLTTGRSGAYPYRHLLVFFHDGDLAQVHAAGHAPDEQVHFVHRGQLLYDGGSVSPRLRVPASLGVQPDLSPGQGGKDSPETKGGKDKKGGSGALQKKWTG